MSGTAPARLPGARPVAAPTDNERENLLARPAAVLARPAPGRRRRLADEKERANDHDD